MQTPLFEKEWFSKVREIPTNLHRNSCEILRLRLTKSKLRNISSPATRNICANKIRSPVTRKGLCRSAGVDKSLNRIWTIISGLFYLKNIRAGRRRIWLGLLTPTAGHAPSPTHPPTCRCHAVGFYTPKLSFFGKKDAFFLHSVETNWTTFPHNVLKNMISFHDGHNPTNLKLLLRVNDGFTHV